MPMFSDAAKNLMLDALDGVSPAGIGMLSLHSSYSVNGANEITGGSPVYARQPVTWYAANLGIKTVSSGAAIFDVPAGIIGWVGYWSTEVVPTFLGMAPLGGSAVVPFVVDNVPSATLQAVGHPFTIGMSIVAWQGLSAVQVLPLESGAPFAPLVEGVQYFVTAVPTTDTLELSTALSGIPISFASGGGGFLQAFTPTEYFTQGQYTVNIFALDARVLG